MDAQTLAAGLAIGLTLGVIAGLLITRARAAAELAQASSAGTAARAVLEERLEGIKSALARESAAKQQCEDKARDFQSALDRVRQERGVFAERAQRVDGLEQQLAARFEELKVAHGRLADLTGKASEWQQRLASTEKALHQAQTDLLAAQNEAANERRAVVQLTERAANAEKELTLTRTAIEQIRLERESVAKARDELAAELTGQTAAASGNASALASTVKELEQAREELARSVEAYRALTQEQQLAKARLAELENELANQRKQAGEKLALLSEAKAQLSDQFKSLANEILEDKSRRFTEVNATNLQHLLGPLGVKIAEFQGRVEQTHGQDSRERTILAEQVRQLTELNRTLSDDAQRLTKALKNDSQTQGAWGELILERVLEMSGLRNGHEFETQEHHRRDDGSAARPDVVVYLPEGRRLIVDSKVSLRDYEAHASAATDTERAEAIAKHLHAIRSHVRELSERNYQALYPGKSVDFVVMFIPVEPAFMLAMTEDREVWNHAWTKNVLMVCPSTFIAVVRMIAFLWRQEQHNRNAQDIAKRGAELYDKLVSFVDDLSKVGRGLEQANFSYESAMKRLSTGRGNALAQAEKLRDLGVKPTKNMNGKLLESALSEAAFIEEGVPNVLLSDEGVRASIN